MTPAEITPVDRMSFLPGDIPLFFRQLTNSKDRGFFFNYTDKIDPSSSGKLRYTISNIRNNDSKFR